MVWCVWVCVVVVWVFVGGGGGGERRAGRRVRAPNARPMAADRLDRVLLEPMRVADCKVLADSSISAGTGCCSGMGPNPKSRTPSKPSALRLRTSVP